MSQPERDDEQDRGGEVVPFPTRQLPEVPAAAEVEPAEAPIEGELVTEQDYQERKELQRRAPVTVLVQVVQVVRESKGTSTAGKATLRAGVTVGQGFGSWVRRGYDAATLGMFRQEIAAARAAGDHERVADWTSRREQAKKERHQRLMDAPKLMVGVAIVAGGCLLGLVVMILLVGLLAQVSGAGEFLGVLSWTLGAVRFLFDAAPVVVTVAAVLTPPAVLWAAWREGMRTGTAPRWLLNPEQRAQVASTITPDVLAAALQHVKVPALTKFLAGGGRLEFVVQPREQGGGTYTQIRLPIGSWPPSC